MYPPGVADIFIPPEVRPQTLWRDLSGGHTVLLRRTFEFKDALYVTYRHDAQLITLPAEYFIANFGYVGPCDPASPALAGIVAQDRLVADIQTRTLPAILYILQHPERTHEVNEAAKQYALVQAEEYGIKDFIDAHLVVREITAEKLLEGVGPDFWSRLNKVEPHD